MNRIRLMSCSAAIAEEAAEEEEEEATERSNGREEEWEQVEEVERRRTRFKQNREAVEMSSGCSHDMHLCQVYVCVFVSSSSF